MSLEVFVGIFFNELDGAGKIVNGPQFYWVFRSGNQFIKADPKGKKSARPSCNEKPQEGKLYRVHYQKPDADGFCEIWQIYPIPSNITY